MGNDETTETTTETADKKARGQKSGGSPLYALGMIGALVWFWQQATTDEERVQAVLKAFVWPAILVHDAFEALSD